MKRHRFSLMLASCLLAMAPAFAPAELVPVTASEPSAIATAYASPASIAAVPGVIVVASVAEAEHLCTRAVRPAPTRHFVQTRERAKRPNTDGRGGPSFVRDAGTRYLQG